MLRKISSVIVGVILGVIVIVLLELLGHYFYPTDISLGLSDEEKLLKMKEYVEGAPLMALLFVPLSYFVGSFVGSAAAMLIYKQNVVAYSAGGVLLIFGIINLFEIPHPIWLGGLIIISFPFGTWLAIKSRSISYN